MIIREKGKNIAMIEEVAEVVVVATTATRDVIHTITTGKTTAEEGRNMMMITMTMTMSTITKMIVKREAVATGSKGTEMATTKGREVVEMTTMTEVVTEVIRVETAGEVALAKITAKAMTSMKTDRSNLRVLQNRFKLRTRREFFTSTI